MRLTSPLTNIGRVCPRGAEVGGFRIAPDARVSLCWASANFDETVFDVPEKVRLNRAPNPHVGFGSGHHNCLGAAHARTLLRSLIRQPGGRTTAMVVLNAERAVENYGTLVRKVGYRSLRVSMVGSSQVLHNRGRLADDERVNNAFREILTMRRIIFRHALFAA